MKNIFKKFLASFGVGIHRVPTPEELKDTKNREVLWLRKLGIKTVIDIGANTGQFAASMNEIFPDARLYSFEPQKDCYEELLIKFKDVSCFHAFNIALGNEAGELEFYRNDYSQSSSLLPMAELHKTSYPFTKNSMLDKVEVTLLDNIFQQLEIETPFLIKVDVQGFEDKVIEGGKKTFSQAKVVIIEMSFEVLYEGQKLFDEMYQIMRNFGFEYRGSLQQLLNPDDGRVLQEDAIFMRNS
jgi:FkbM family methyltransferase